jgi:hypothetical protein
MPLSSTILMIRPAAFGYNAETAANNFFQSDPSSKSKEDIQQKALKEFDAMVSVLRKNEIEVLVIEDTAEPVKPDAVFPNNWLCTLGGGIFCVFPMFAKSRRLEKRDDVIQQLVHSFKVADFQDWSEYEADGRYLEGTGSMLIDQENKLIFACLSDRTDASVLEKFAKRNGYNAMAFTATDMEGLAIYHTNVMMALGENFCILCEEAIEDETEIIALKQLINSTDKKIISISRKQMQAFAGNMLELKNKNDESILVMSKTAYKSLTDEQLMWLEKYSKLLPIDVPTIERVEGGSVRCMMAEIFLDNK